MVFVQSTTVPWHEGELRLHGLLHPANALTSSFDNPTSPFLTSGAARHLSRAPLLAVGALDEHSQPWTTVWADGGRSGFMAPVGNSTVAIKVPVDACFDPVVHALLGKANATLEKGADGVASNGTNPHEAKGRKMVAGLSIDLETRSRVKLSGRMLAGAVRDPGGEDVGGTTLRQEAEAQLVVSVEQSLGNCPKYITARAVYGAPSKPRLLADSAPLPQRALDVIAKADLFFVSSAHDDQDMDTNHRGGPPGFVRVVSNKDESHGGLVLAWPEYSGNRLYQTLGNLASVPKAGLVFPDFETGDVLYVTGSTETLIGPAAEEVLPHSNLVVLLRVAAARFVVEGLNFRGRPGEPSPYNPRLRLLRGEGATAANDNSQRERPHATLVQQERLTPGIFRARFRISSRGEPVTWKPGQYVALSFEDELSMGYSHMRDDDPRSLNDDYLRTFTVSSAPTSAVSCAADLPCDQPPADEFEITYRALGKVTNYLSRQHARSGLEVPLRGFEGTFSLPALDVDSPALVAYVAGGVGITPLLAHLPLLHQSEALNRLRLFWTVRADDLGLVEITLKHFPRLGSFTRVHVTGGPLSSLDESRLDRLKERTAVSSRRMRKEDVLPGGDEDGDKEIRSITTWYICAGTILRETVTRWLEDDAQQPKEIVIETFDY